MTINTLKILLLFNMWLIVSCIWDKKYPWAVYWTGALLINSAVMWMMSKK